MSTHNPVTRIEQSGPLASGATASRQARREGEHVLKPGFRWRGELISLNLFTLLLGGWLIASPWALDYAGTAARINAWACGGAICLLTLVSAVGLAKDFLRWFNALIGVWLIVTVVTIANGTAAKWNDLVIGFLAFLASSALWEMVPHMRGSATD